MRAVPNHPGIPPRTMSEYVDNDNVYDNLGGITVWSCPAVFQAVSVDSANLRRLENRVMSYTSLLKTQGTGMHRYNIPSFEKRKEKILDSMQAELAKQNFYLKSIMFKRYSMEPEIDSLFRALYKCHKCSSQAARPRDANDLKYLTLDYIRTHLDDFKQFMEHGNDDEMVVRKHISAMEGSTLTVPHFGYECFMALTRVLEAEILVTMGGNGEGPVRTNAYNFGQMKPKRELHICWVSLGFYDAVVPQDEMDSDYHIFSISERAQLPEIFDHYPKPSHECDFWICPTARKWERPWFPLEETKMPNVLDKSIVSERCILWLSEQAGFIENWRFILRKLEVDNKNINTIQHDSNGEKEKAYQGLRVWLNSQHPATYQKLISGLEWKGLHRTVADLKAAFL